MAYADDLVLMGSSTGEVNCLLKRCTSFLEKRHLTINAAKSTAVTCQVVPKKKRLFVATTSKFYIDGVAIPQLQPQETFKYLGHRYGALGVVNADIDDLKTNLKKVEQAALPPKASHHQAIPDTEIPV